jgi:uncharacterized membrane protein YeiH
VFPGPIVAAIMAEEGPVTTLLQTHPALPDWSPYAAVAFGALAGAAFAAQRGFDVIGVLGLAVAQGMGGLLLMEILLQTGTPAVLTDGRYLMLVAIASAIGFFFAGLLAVALRSAALFDALSLGLLCAIGTNAALRSGLDSLPAVFIGVMTAVGGLILRDVMAGRAPEILRPGTYAAFAALVGASVFVLLVDFGASRAFAQIATVIVVTAVRLLSIRYGWVTHEATDFSNKVWGIWKRKPPEPDVGPTTGYFDRSDR